MLFHESDYYCAVFAKNILGDALLTIEDLTRRLALAFLLVDFVLAIEAVHEAAFWKVGTFHFLEEEGAILGGAEAGPHGLVVVHASVECQDGQASRQLVAIRNVHRKGGSLLTLSGEAVPHHRQLLQPPILPQILVAAQAFLVGEFLREADAVNEVALLDTHTRAIVLARLPLAFLLIYT